MRRSSVGGNRVVTAVSSVLTVLLIGSLLTVASAALHNAAATCPEFEFIGARGSGEAPHNTVGTPSDYDEAHQFGLGDRVFDVFDKLVKDIGPGRVSAHGVRYPAQGIFGGSDTIDGIGAFLHLKPLGAYTDSVRAGTTDTISELNHEHAACPATKFFLAGYSQGAQAVGDAIQRLSAQQLSWIVGAAFFGDPYFRASSWSSQASDSHFGLLGVRGEWPEALHGRLFSFCHTHDPVCGISKRLHIFGDGDIYYRDVAWFRGGGPHSNYVPAGTTKAAATQLAGLVGIRPVPVDSPLDLAFAIDSTGSMGTIIESVKNNVSALASAIASTSTDFRFALVDYKDVGDPYQARLDIGFTTDVSAFTKAVSGLSADGGGDTPESVYSGVMTALNLPWRAGVRKIVIPIGDAPGKDPEPVTGFTLSQVQAKALAIDPAQIYPLVAAGDPNALAFMQAMADATAGKVTVTDGVSDVVEQLKKLIVQAGSAPVADAGGPYDAHAGDPITLSAGGSRPGTDLITKYAWDWNSDGVTDAETPDPVIGHTFAAPGNYQITLRATDASGLSGTASATVSVTSAPPSAPAVPRSLKATAGDASVSIAWTEQTTPVVAQYFVIRSADGTVLDTVSALADGSAPAAWVDDALTNGVSYGYSVAAGNARGESASAGPVFATPHGATTNQSVLARISGKNSVSAFGRLDAGGFAATRTSGRLVAIHGSGTVHMQWGPVTVTIDATRAKPAWTASMSIAAPTGTVSVSGHGAVYSLGWGVSGTFVADSADRQSFAFAIVGL